MTALLPIFILAASSAVVLFAALFSIFIIYATVLGSIKGAPFVRSPQKKIQLALELADIKTGEKLVDLGSGDGTLLIEAARRGAQAVGIEMNPFLVAYSRWRIKKNKLSDKVRVVRNNFYNYNLREADIVFTYLWPETNELLKPKFTKELKKGSRIISCDFLIRGWQPLSERDGVYLYQI